MVKYLTLIAIVVSLAACGSGKNRSTKHTTTVLKDSTVTEIRYQKRDTLITIPGDTLRVTIPYSEITKEGKKITQGNQTVSIAKDNAGNVVVDCITAEIQRLLQLQDQIITTLRKIESDTKETTIVPQRYVPFYIKALAWMGGIFIFLIGIGLILKIKP